MTGYMKASRTAEMYSETPFRKGLFFEEVGRGQYSWRFQIKARSAKDFGWGTDGSNDLTLRTVNSPHRRSIWKLWVGNARDRDVLVDS